MFAWFAVTIATAMTYLIAKVGNEPEGWTPFFNRQMSQFGTGQTYGSNGRCVANRSVGSWIGSGKMLRTRAKLGVQTASKAATKALLGTCA